MSYISPVITLTTDFGTNDAYVASMKGVILSINPSAVIVDICHMIEPQNIAQAAFILNTTHPYFPEGTIHVAIVDPGVGSKRKAIILKTPRAFFIAPDNGILSYIVDELCPRHTKPPSQGSLNHESRELGTGAEAIAVTNPHIWNQSISTTFHGRDIFAPVAARLSLGVPCHEFGESISSVDVFPIPQPYLDAKGDLIGHILHIDHFGNLITNIKHSDLTPEANVIIEIGKHHIHGLSHFYAQEEGLSAIIGSSNYLEISLKNSNAAAFIDAKVSAEIRVRPTDGE